jgi:hypothetical protein
MSLVAHSHCVTCGEPLSGPYCSQCGERSLAGHSYSLRHFAEEALENLAHLDNRILRTFRVLLTRPGALAADFLDGRRKPYMGPVQLFVTANLLYFLLQPFSGFVPFTTTLRIQTTQFWWSGLAKQMTSDTIAAKHIAFEQYERDFNATAHLQGKTLVIIMVPFFAVIVWALYGRTRRYYAEHLVFSFYAFAFLLIWIGVTSVISSALLTGASRLGLRPGPLLVEVSSSLFTAVPFGVYLCFAARRTYGESNALRCVKSAVLTVALVLVATIYRFILFFTTFFAT